VLRVSDASPAVDVICCTDFADDTYMYMLRCHLLQHEDEGLMASLMVTES
jgi:FtsP/CotA-like multicopper oxidase with cupredoxin domain